ncbi:hypothetical protein Pcinc_013798 [Petrolisthes cinctipes]|uniref:Nephrin n=1 Tax=Petrolisthes cinctipes TaxID=88211 RepID=A0AAE1FY48_PETCI|nr:hypothetical protein Pcinc_013798 [Petrolisthes cinctipes]
MGGSKEDVEGVVGGVGKLPCRYYPRTPGDIPRLLLWYKEGVSKPVFSYDTRTSPPGDQTRPDGIIVNIGHVASMLTLPNLTRNHSGLYECRVQFHASPSVLAFVNLTVVEPVRSVIVEEADHGVMKSWVLGPYRVGHTINVTCVAGPGFPRPTVKWWAGDKVLKSSHGRGGDDRVENRLVVVNISRAWHNRVLTCIANNTHLKPSALASLTVNMTLLARSVLVSDPGALLEGRTARLTCRALGSNPPSALAWTLNSTTVPASKSWMEGNETLSDLVLKISRRLHNVRVSCTATNPSIPLTTVSNTTTLLVHYPPTVRASLGPKLSLDVLKEGNDVYFMCDVDASPPATTLTWYHEGGVVEGGAGVVRSGNSLVLQGAGRKRAGRYRCAATNTLATVTSPPVTLTFRYKPECLSSLTTYFIYDKSINVTCTLTSHPPVTSIYWRWAGRGAGLGRGGGDVSSTTPERVEGQVVSGQLTVRPSPGGDDRKLTCWGVNDMGQQQYPCNFSIKAASVPVSSCRVAHITSNSLSLTCHTPSLTPTHTPSSSASTTPENTTIYTAEVYFANQTLYRNVSSMQPTFNVSQLDAGTSYQIKVYVTQGPVTSPPVLVSAYTSRTPPEGGRDGVGDGGAAAGGVVGGMLVAAGVAGLAVWARLYWRKKVRRGSGSPRTTNKSLSLTTSDDTRPMLHHSEGWRGVPVSVERWHRGEEPVYQVVAADDDDDDDDDGDEDELDDTDDSYKVEVAPSDLKATVRRVGRNSLHRSNKKGKDELDSTINEDDDNIMKEAKGRKEDTGNCLGELVQLIPKECEDTLARKLQHVGGEERGRIDGGGDRRRRRRGELEGEDGDKLSGREWLQYLPEGWVIASSPHSLSNIESSSEYWTSPELSGSQTTTGFDSSLDPIKESEHNNLQGDNKKHPQILPSLDPKQLAESFEDWRLKYVSCVPLPQTQMPPAVTTDDHNNYNFQNNPNYDPKYDHHNAMYTSNIELNHLNNSLDSLTRRDDNHYCSSALQPASRSNNHNNNNNYELRHTPSLRSITGRQNLDHNYNLPQPTKPLDTNKNPMTSSKLRQTPRQTNRNTHNRISFPPPLPPSSQSFGTPSVMHHNYANTTPHYAGQVPTNHYRNSFPPPPLLPSDTFGNYHNYQNLVSHPPPPSPKRIGHPHRASLPPLSKLFQENNKCASLPPSSTLLQENLNKRISLPPSSMEPHSRSTRPRDTQKRWSLPHPLRAEDRRDRMRQEQGRDLGLGVRFRAGQHVTGQEQRAGVALRQERTRDPRLDISATIEMDLGRGALPRSGSSSDSDVGLGRGMALGQVVERDLEEEEEEEEGEDDEMHKQTVRPGINLWQGQWLGQRSGLEVDDRLGSGVAGGVKQRQDKSPGEGQSLELAQGNVQGQNMDLELSQRNVYEEPMDPVLNHSNVHRQRGEPEGERRRQGGGGGGVKDTFNVNGGDLSSCSFQQLMFAEETDL